MTILDFQETIAEKLRDDGWMLAHGIPVVCENALDAEASAARALEEAGGICLVVMTPALDSIGRDEDGDEVVEVSELALAVGETAANRQESGRATALDVAAKAALVLTHAWPDRVTFGGIRQTEESGMLVATARLATGFTLVLNQED